MIRDTILHRSIRNFIAILFLALGLSACSWDGFWGGLYESGKRWCDDGQRVCGPKDD